MDEMTGIGEDIKEFIVGKPIQTAAIGVGVLGVGALGARLLLARNKKAPKRKRVRSKVGRRKDWRFASKQKHERAYRKRRKKLGRPSYQKKYKRKTIRKGGRNRFIGKIHYTKKGQPYKILANGRARFIKKTKGRKR